MIAGCVATLAIDIVVSVCFAWHHFIIASVEEQKFVTETHRIAVTAASKARVAE
jgi:hypothetical protein